MANTTSGTTTFDKTFAIDEIIEEAFERIGQQNVAGYQLKNARRTLNILLQEWGNRGIHYWEIDELNMDLIEGQSDYDFLDLALMARALYQHQQVYLVYQMFLKHS